MKCPYCEKEAVWCENKEIYGKNYGKSYMVYYCEDCNAYVGCHQNTEKPLGTMANAELRQWRKKVHTILDPLWLKSKNRRGERQRVYTRIGNGIFTKSERKRGKEFHVGESDIETCKLAIKFLAAIK